MDETYCSICGCGINDDEAQECECGNIVCSCCWSSNVCVECEGKDDTNYDDDERDKEPCLN